MDIGFASVLGPLGKCCVSPLACVALNKELSICMSVEANSSIENLNALINTMMDAKAFVGSGGSLHCAAVYLDGLEPHTQEWVRLLGCLHTHGFAVQHGPHWQLTQSALKNIRHCWTIGNRTCAFAIRPDIALEDRSHCELLLAVLEDGWLLAVAPRRGQVQPHSMITEVT